MADDDTPSPDTSLAITSEDVQELKAIGDAMTAKLVPRIAQLRAQAQADVDAGRPPDPRIADELASLYEPLGQLLELVQASMEHLHARVFAQAEMFYFHVLELAKQGDARAAEIAADLTPRYLAQFPVEDTQLPS